MSNAPRVSVILPTYNRQNLVGQAIESVLSQTLKDFELIVVDDGSTDRTEEVVKSFSDPRVIYVKLPRSERSAARNEGIKRAHGKYIAFIDSDDIYSLPEKLALQVSHFENNPQDGMIYTSSYCVDENLNKLDTGYKATASGKIYSRVAFFADITITLPTVMVRREVIEKAGPFDINMNRFEDTDMWRRISKITNIYAMPIETCAIRAHSGNDIVAQSPMSIVQSLDYYVNKIKIEDTDAPIWQIRRGIGSMYRYYGIAFRLIPEFLRLGNSMMEISYRYWPFSEIRPVLFKPLAVVRLLRRRFILKNGFRMPQRGEMGNIIANGTRNGY